MEDLNNRKWKMMYKTAKEAGGVNFKTDLFVRLTLVLTDTTDMAKLKKKRPDLYDILYKSQAGKTYLSEINGADVIGGNKGLQLRSKINFVRSFKKCNYNDLGLQPMQVCWLHPISLTG